MRALPACRLVAVALLAAACDEAPVEPRPTLADEVRALALDSGLAPLRPPPPVRPELVRLGQALAFDPILSGGRDISCMTCHHPSLATGDGRQLPLGQGATGLGSRRVHPRGARVGRHSPALFNLHALDHLFWDGRLARGPDGRLRTPAGAQLTPEMERVFEFGALSAQPLFPVLSRVEMRGDSGNELATVPDDSAAAVWRALMARLGAVSEYRAMFEAAYPGTPFDSMSFAHASNAIAGFLVDRLSFTDSPWDRFLRGDDRALSREQLLGVRHFVAARCSACHSGAALSDDAFHNVALPQFGPGTGDGPTGRDDYGRARVSGDPRDRYAFRTPPLRNVELTAPFGHAGQFLFLSDFVDHYSEPERKLRGYEASQIEPALRATLLDNREAILATRDSLIAGVVLPDSAIRQITLLLRALTDPAARDLAHLIPERVPSGLPVERR